MSSEGLESISRKAYQEQHSSIDSYLGRRSLQVVRGATMSVNKEGEQGSSTAYKERIVRVNARTFLVDDFFAAALAFGFLVTGFFASGESL
jgi:hypothetical protein